MDNQDQSTKTKMASGAAVNNRGPLEPELVDKLAVKLHGYVEKDQLWKAKIALMCVRKEDKKRIVSQTFDGKAPLFIAVQQGLSNFVNYLLKDCHANVEQRGVYKGDATILQHVTPLWCAAAANRLDVVKILIRHSAEVNATCDTESNTPILVACLNQNFEVVKYLAKHGANIDQPNIHGSTCLISSVQRARKSFPLCQYLLKKKANVNAQQKNGCTALLVATNMDLMQIVPLLLKHGSDPNIKNCLGDDAFQMAAIHGCSKILEYLLSFVKPAKERHIEALELMGTFFLIDCDYFQQAMNYWRQTIEMRYNDKANIIEKPKVTPNALFQNHHEATTLAELESMVTNKVAISVQAVMISHRILGPKHHYTSLCLFHQGDVYARTHQYQQYLDTYAYAFQFQDTINLISFCILECLCKELWEIYEWYFEAFTREQVMQFNGIYEVFEMCVSQLKSTQEDYVQKASHQINPSAFDHDVFYFYTLRVLHLIHLLCAITKPDDEERVFRFKQAVHKLTKLNIRSRGKSLLHLAADKKTSHVSNCFLSQFPSENVVKVLLECGADPTVVDNDGNTPLHILCTAASNVTDHNDRTPMIGMIDALLKAGAHVDCVNNNGVIATHMLSSWYPQYCELNHLSLKCLAARVVKKFNIPYTDVNGESQVPSTLLSFLDMH